MSEVNEILKKVTASIEEATSKFNAKAEDALKACRYEAYEFYVRLVDEMFSDMSNTDITAKAKLIAKKP